jgi:hypothetical protein
MIRLNVSGGSSACAEYRSQIDHGAVTPDELPEQCVGMQASE